jgi:hypothetical protein
MSMHGYERLVEPHMAELRRSRDRTRRTRPNVRAAVDLHPDTKQVWRGRLGMALVHAGLWLLASAKASPPRSLSNPA